MVTSVRSLDGATVRRLKMRTSAASRSALIPNRKEQDVVPLKDWGGLGAKSTSGPSDADQCYGRIKDCFCVPMYTPSLIPHESSYHHTCTMACPPSCAMPQPATVAKIKSPHPSHHTQTQQSSSQPSSAEESQHDHSSPYSAP